MRYSILVPVYNSSMILKDLLAAIEDTRRKENWDLELVLVEDGSKDNSFEVIEQLAKEYHYIKGIKLARNFGHQAAVRTALNYVTGDYIAIIDDDMQDPPDLLPRFFQQLDEGFDVAYGVRRKRKEHFIKVTLYNLFYRFLQKISSVHIPLDSGDFCVMKKRVVSNMIQLQERNPFLRGIRAWVGFKQIGLEYERHARAKGESGYTFRKLIKIAMDGIFAFSSLPIKIISITGFLGLSFSIFYSIYILWVYLTKGIQSQGFLTLVLMIAFFNSLILICLGIIGEYVIKIYDETRARPYSVIEKTINISNPNS
ncbi:MAG: glycosyltransferase family 2 protein [Saprospiraceae bacterium]